MKITLIAAISGNNVIGADGKLPWNLPDDLKHFKKYTLGKTIVMGANTFRSIGSNPLPGRRNIVLSNGSVTPQEGVEVYSSIADIIEECTGTGADELVVIGGSEVYKSFFPIADEMVITHVRTWCAGGVFFPEINYSNWREVDVVYSGNLEGNDHSFEIVKYERW